MTLKLSMTCGPYDRAKALIDGSVKLERIDLAITVNSDDVSRHLQGMQGKFDVVEFFTSRYIADLRTQYFWFCRPNIAPERFQEG